MFLKLLYPLVEFLAASLARARWVAPLPPPGCPAAGRVLGAAAHRACLKLGPAARAGALLSWQLPPVASSVR